jgi:hypothetical protein
MPVRRVMLSLLMLLVTVSATQAQKKTVIYERKGPGLLLAAIEGTYKGKEEREEFQMRKVRCNPKDE